MAAEARSNRDLSVEYRAFHDEFRWMTGVVVLVDGHNMFDALSPGEYIGLPPDDLVSQHGLLRPSNLPAEVRLGRCSCGETGCGKVAARCYRYRDHVVWDQLDHGNPSPRSLDAPHLASDALVFTADTYDRFATHVDQLATRYPGW